MATAVYLVQGQHPKGHVRHAVRSVQVSQAVIRRLYRHPDAGAIDAEAERRGIGFVLVLTWAGAGAAFERRLKRQKHHSRLCPACNPTGYAGRTTRTAAG